MNQFYFNVIMVLTEHSMNQRFKLTSFIRLAGHDSNHIQSMSFLSSPFMEFCAYFKFILCCISSSRQINTCAPVFIGYQTVTNMANTQKKNINSDHGIQRYIQCIPYMTIRLNKRNHIIKKTPQYLELLK